jgi:putative ABC transport system permease protein
MLRNFFKTAWRSLLRNKAVTAINVFGLALGITVCLIVFLLVKYELGYDRFHPGGDRIYRVVATSARGDGFSFVPAPASDDARAELSGLERVAGFDTWFPKVTAPQEGKPNRVFEAPERGEAHPAVILVQPEYFDIFPYRWLAGNAATALDDPFRVVLTANEATKYFGRQDPDQWLGRRLIYSDSLEVTVSGIVADWEGNTDLGFMDFISHSTIKSSWLGHLMGGDGWKDWDNDSYAFVKLAPGVSPARVAQQLPAFTARHWDGEGKSPTLALQPLTDIHFNDKYDDTYSRKAYRPTLYGLAAIAAFILLIAAVNFINLSTAQSVRRSREIGIRKVLGGRRGALMLQFLTETLVLVVAAAALALLIANPLLAAFQSLLPSGVQLVVFQRSTLLFLAAIVVVTCLLAGWYPARVLSSYQPVESLKGQGGPQLNNKSYLRKALIVFQFTVSLIFIIGTLVIGRQIHYMLNTDLGFDHDAIVNISSGGDGPQHRWAVLNQKFREIPEVEGMARSTGTPLAGAHAETSIEYKDPKDHKVEGSFDMVDTGYIHVYGMPIVAGRNLFPADTVHEFLINETGAKQLDFRHPADALGHIVEMGMRFGTGPIVGVIKDFHSESMHAPIRPFFFITYTQAESNISVKLATTGQSADRLAAVLRKLEKAWKEVYPETKFQYQFFDDTIARLYDKEQKTAEIMNIAMGIAIFISCMGLFGLAAFVAEQRTKEIGIRKVLGATVVNIVTMLSTDFLRLVGLAILIASPVAWYFVHKWLQDFAYRIPISWWIFVIAGACAVGVALLTVSYRAFRAATANPVDSLRSE